MHARRLLLYPGFYARQISKIWEFSLIAGALSSSFLMFLPKVIVNKCRLFRSFSCYCLGYTMAMHILELVFSAHISTHLFFFCHFAPAQTSMMVSLSEYDLC